VAANQPIGTIMKYDYGDDLRVRTTAGAVARGAELCTVVGITTVESDRQAETFGWPIGSTLYTVEFGDGSDALLPEEALEPIEPQAP